MPRIALPTQTPVAAGVTPVYNAANAAGYSCDPDTIIHVKNGSGAPINVTITTPATAAGLAVADQVQAVAAGAERIFHVPRSEQDTYRNPTGATDAGLMYVDFSAVATVTVAAYVL